MHRLAFQLLFVPFFLAMMLAGTIFGAACREARAAEPVSRPYTLVIHDLARDGIFVPVIAPRPEVTPTPVIAEPAVPDLVCSYPWPCAQALAVMQCESSGNPYATNGRYLGLFQIRDDHFAHYGYPVALWFDPATNIAVAWRLYQDSGWGPWECKP